MTPLLQYYYLAIGQTSGLGYKRLWVKLLRMFKFQLGLGAGACEDDEEVLELSSFIPGQKSWSNYYKSDDYN